jgi:hypothetical protein
MDSKQRYLDGQYYEDNSTFHVEDSPWKSQQIARMLDRHQLSPKSVCEIGCGSGEILRQLQLRYPNIPLYHGYEISPQGYELALQRQNEGLHFFNANLFDEQEAHYKLALCIDVVEHVEDYFEFLRNLHRHADHFIFHFPLDMNVQMVWRSEPILRLRRHAGHLHYFSKDTVLATLGDTGYRVQDWFYTATLVDRPKSLKGVIAKIPRQLAGHLSPDLAARVLGGYSLIVYAL